MVPGYLQVSGETDWHLESSQLLQCNGGVCVFSDASIPRKASDVAAISEILEHSRLSIGKGSKNHQLVDASVSIVYLIDGSLRSLPHKSADTALKQFDLCLDMNEVPDDALDTDISSFFLQDEQFLDSQPPSGGPAISENALVSLLAAAAASRPTFGAGGIRMLSAWLEAARQAMASRHCSVSMYQQHVLERLCRGVAKLRLSNQIEACDVVIGINLYEESRVAKGLPSMLGFELRSNGRQNLDLLDRDPILAHAKLRSRILSVCQSYGTHFDSSDEEMAASGADEDDWA